MHMSKRRMVGWRPLAVENTDAPAETTAPPTTTTEPAPAAEQPEAAVQHTATAHDTGVVQEPARQDGPVQDPHIPRRRMAGWEPLAVANTAGPAPATPAPAAAVSHQAASAEPEAAAVAPEPVAATPASAPVQPASAGPLQDPSIPRRRMAGWQPLAVAHDAPTAVSELAEATQAPQAAEPLPAATAEPQTAIPETPASETPAPAAPVPVTDDVPRRRMAEWTPLAVGHPGTAVPADVDEPVIPPVEEPAPVAPPAVEPAEAKPAVAKPAPKRMGTPAATSAPKRMGSPAAPATDQPVTTPEVVTSAAATPAPQAEKTKPKQMSKVGKVLITLGIVAVVAAGLVLLAQWIRTLDPVANFIGTYEGTPTHPQGVVAGIPGWVGWQHFFNFFIIVMVIRSGLLIRYQQRPEAYWTPTEGGFFSPGAKNTPQKVTIQQWIHQSFNVLWVVNGLVFYIMVFATGHWMRIVPTNWDIFPNIVSAGIQYLSLDWPPENAWVYYNALQMMTYFITIFIAAPLAVLTGLRLSTWWPQKAERINKAFSLPVARTIHFVTMVYFVLFIIVHLFLVFTTGVLTNLNMMFTARHVDDWIGIAVFAVSVAVTVGIAWLLKPIFISGIAEKTGQVSTR